MINRIQAEYKAVNWQATLGTAATALVGVVPYALGWLIGKLVAGAALIVGAFVAGYKDGRGT